MKKQQESFEHEVEIILDTNMLMTPSQISFDIFEAIKDSLFAPEISFSVLQTTITELSSIAQARTKEAREAKIALQLIKQKKVTIVPAPIGMEKLSYADIVISAYAFEQDKNPKKSVLVATNDRMLKKQLLEKNISVVSIAGKQRVFIRRAA